MKRITYISNTNIGQNSGGGSGINFATYQELTNHFNVAYCGPINPANDLSSKILSKLKRKLGGQGNYHFFSEKRLSQINKEVKKIGNPQSTEGYFFHGFTPWIKTTINKPYFCFNDACFATYVEIYNNKDEFSQKDLRRVFKQEALWLSKASKVFFRSQWALEETKNHYNLSGENFRNVGVGGFIEIPEQDKYQKGYNFLFLSREFLPKGGMIAVSALQIVRRKYPEANLWIVGQQPPEEVLKTDGIVYKGFFHKNVESERKQLVEIFEETFALVHPTLKDTNTLVITELAYFGCPAVSTNSFAIPEYLLEGETGFLLNDPRNEKELAEKMLLLIEDPKLYAAMRLNARKNAITNNTWEKVGQRIVKEVKEVL